jgi:hypothetical protein
VVLSMGLSLLVALNPSSLQPPQPTETPFFITPLFPEQVPTATAVPSQTPTPGVTPAPLPPPKP